MKKDTWVVVSNSSFAKIYKAENNNLLKELQVLEHPESRQHEGDLTTTKPGRQFDRLGMGRHALQQETSPKQQEFITFARQISTLLDEARESGRVGKIYLTASPSFLGLLRQEMSSATEKLIAGEVPKDMTHLEPKDIREHLPLVL